MCVFPGSVWTKAGSVRKCLRIQTSIIVNCQQWRIKYLDPVYTVADTLGHDMIEFGHFAVIFTRINFLGSFVIKFCNTIINLKATLVFKLFNLIS